MTRRDWLDDRFVPFWLILKMNGFESGFYIDYKCYDERDSSFI